MKQESNYCVSPYLSFSRSPHILHGAVSQNRAKIRSFIYFERAQSDVTMMQQSRAQMQFIALGELMLTKLRHDGETPLAN